MPKDYNFINGLLDEIALEGLDGITLEMLWQRLRDRPDFPIPVDEDSKVFFWKMAAMHKDIEIFKLPEPRKFSIYNRYDHIDPDLCVVVEPEKLDPDPYAPVVAIKDGDVRGSCSTYKERECITSEIRNDILLVPLQEAEETWGDSLVLVASPKRRLIALIGTVTNPLIDLSLDAYCLLERIGRSRYLGEVTQGKEGLLSLKASFCKQLHYLRKKLTVKGLVTKQNHCIKNKKGKSFTGSLFHLTRFFVKRKTKMATLRKRLCDILKDKPRNQEAYKVLKGEMKIPDKAFRKLFSKEFEKWVTLVSIPCQEFCPDGTQKDWFTVHGEPKEVKVCQLLRHCDEDDDLDFEELYDDREEEANDDREEVLPSNIYFDSSKISYGMPLVHQVYGHIRDAGPEGISIGDLGRTMTLPRLDIRSYLTLLVNKGHITYVVHDRGRQKVNKYIAKTYEDNHANKKPMRVHEENANHSVRKRKGSIEGECIDAPAIKRSRMNQGNVLPHYADTDIKRKRSDMILEYIKSKRFATLSDLNSHVLEKEKLEGYAYKLDKRSTTRLLKSLYYYKKIKIFNFVIESENEPEGIDFFCENSLDRSDPLLRAAIDDKKFRKSFVSKLTSDKTPPANKHESSSSVPNSSPARTNERIVAKEKSTKKHVTKQPSEVIFKYPRVTPRFLRAKTLHSFLFYLAYKHKVKPSYSDEQVVYHEALNWRRFVPPLNERTMEGIGEGWVVLSDIYSHMPLSLFVKIVNFSNGFPELSKYLGNEEKSHYLIKFLPQNLRNNLFHNRKFLFSTKEIVNVLCYLGLVSIGPPIGKQKDQFFLYIHKHASIKDTKTSPTGYLHIKKDLNYEINSYTFETEDDVETFWVDLQDISFLTSLGKTSAAAGKLIPITPANYKPELISTTKNKPFNEVKDDGNIPGDGLGAGGFDSSLYLHCRRNWQNTIITQPSRNSRMPYSKKDNYLVSMQNLLKSKDKPSTETRIRLQRLTKNTLLTQKENKVSVTKPSEKEKLIPSATKLLTKNTLLTQKGNKVSVTKSPENKKAIVSATKLPNKRERTKIRKVKTFPTRKRMTFYDEKDKAAIMKQNNARSTWTSQEDSFLLLCKVASSFLDPQYCKNLVVPNTVLRDLLYKHVPEISKTKTSKACQRRLRYMMMNPETINSVSVFLGETLQDDELVKEFNFPKPPKTNEMWTSMFTTVVQKLLEKFTSSSPKRCKSFVLPNSREELDRHYELKSYYKTNQNYKDLYKAPKSIEDIRRFVLSSLLLSAMAVTDDTKWSYRLLKLYQCFPETYLASTVSSLRKAGIIALKNRSCKADFKRSPYSSGPYRFSVNYSNALLTKFPVKIFKEAETIFSRLKSLEPGADEELVGDVPPGFAAAVFSLMQTKQLYIKTKIPSQIILFDSSLSKEARSNIVERMTNTLNDIESTELSRLLNNNRVSSTAVKSNKPTNKTSKQKSNIHSQTNEDVFSIADNLSSMENSRMSEIQRSSNASRFALYLLRHEMSQPAIENVQHAQDFIVLNTCNVVCHLEPTSDVPSLPIVPVDIIEDSSDQKLLELNKESLCITKDRMLLTKEKIAEICEQLVKFIHPTILHSNQNYAKQIETIYKNYASNVLADARQIFDAVYVSGEVGIPQKEIWKKFKFLSGNISVLEHLDIFCKSGLAIRAGIVEFNYVCGCFAKNYVLPIFQAACLPAKRKKRSSCSKVSDTNFESNDIPSADANKSADIDGAADVELQMSSNISRNNLRSSTNNITLYFIPRTWRNPDGSLNKPTFFSLLSTVLSHIISMPGISSFQVCERFSATLPPVYTLELIEILEKATCVYKYYCKPLKKKSLFSKPITISVTKNHELEYVDHIEPYPDAVCKIADLRRAIE